GIPSDQAPTFTSTNGWNDSLVSRFLPEMKTKVNYLRAVDLYRKILATQTDNSVTIVTVGFTSNLADLLASEPDQYSHLSGLELIDKKVKKWVAMAGAFPEGKEFNVFKDAKASWQVFQEWPSPILFS